MELETYPTPRQEFVEAVRVCGSRAEGLELLLEVTHFVTPALSHRLRPLLDEWNAGDLYGSRDWATLREVLDVSLPELNGLVVDVCGDRVRLPSHCTTPWHAFVHLACRNTPKDSLPPSMALLEHLAVHPDMASVVGELWAWNDHFAEQWELSDGDGGLAALRARLSGSGGPPPLPGQAAPVLAGESGSEFGRPVIRLFIKVAPDLSPVDATSARQEGRDEPRYWLSACVKYAESPSLHPEAEGQPEEPVPRSEVPSAVARMLTSMAELWHSRSESVVLEFFLPTELLNEPVEWWDRDPDLGYANPLLSKYPEIVIHSLERVQRRELHHAWRMRWARYKSHPDRGDVHLCDPEGRPPDDHLALLDARIGKQEEVVGMVLSEPPSPRAGLGLRELRLGLDLGIPVLIHHREDSTTQELRSLVREVLSEGGLAEVRDRARQWKSESAAGGSGSHDDVVRQLNVVWDDPEQLLDDGGPAAPATFVGGID